jgi:site-specific recombinase XerD
MHSLSLFDFPRLRIHHWSKEWQQCVTHWIQSLWGHAESWHTVDSYTRILTAFTADGRYPEQYTRSDVFAYINSPLVYGKLRGNPPSAGFRNNRLATINSFYRFASNYTITGNDGRPAPLFAGENPCQGLKSAHAKMAPRFLEEETLRRFFAAIPRDTVIGCRDYALMLFYFTTLRRREEVARLLWRDIYPATFSDGNGGRRSGYAFTFYGKGERLKADSQELLPECYEALVHYLTISGRLATMEPDSPLFLSEPLNPETGWPPRDPYRPLQGQSIWQRVKFYARHAGIPESSITTHSLRHSGARERANDGQDIRSIARALRHKQISTTDR